MNGTIAPTRPKLRPQASPPSIREVCLVGSPGRRYVHIAREGIRATEARPRPIRDAGTG